MSSLLSASTVQRRKPQFGTEDPPAETSEDSWVLPLVYLVGGQVVIALVALIWTKVRRKKKGHKNI
jgi:hypothetical protein